VGDRLFEKGTEKFLEQLTQLGGSKFSNTFKSDEDYVIVTVPVIAIFTKYDMLVRNLRYSEGFREVHRSQQLGLDDEASETLLIRESEARLEEAYIQPFKKVAGENIPFIAVSSEWN
jgi:hypothetical protein